MIDFQQSMTGLDLGQSEEPHSALRWHGGRLRFGVAFDSLAQRPVALVQFGAPFEQVVLIRLLGLEAEVDRSLVCVVCDAQGGLCC